MVKPRVFVLSGEGINCEKETAHAFEASGGQPSFVHVRDWIDHPELLSEHQILVLPGGFSFGDELGSGQVLALNIKNKIQDQILAFYERGGLILGICNGFQVLAKLGCLPNLSFTPGMSLAHNKNKRFMDKWVKIKKNPEARNVWTHHLPSEFELPIRHGEGQVVLKNPSELTLQQKVLFYEEDINGSFEQLAAVGDSQGQVLGIMPHPEGAFYQFQNPSPENNKKTFNKGVGALFFESAIQSLK